MMQAIAGAFKIDYLPKENGEIETKMSGFNVTEFKDNQYINIRLNFEDPLVVSAYSEEGTGTKKDNIRFSMD